MSLTVNVEKRLHHFTLQADFSIGNENLAVVGASGSGKSMLLKLIAGIEKPDRGTITINDQICFSQGKINLASQKRKVGYLFQDYALFPHLTLLENLSLVMEGNRREKKEKAVHFLRRFHLEHVVDAYPETLSGGEKQRAALARMLCVDPQVLLLDEPFSALDTNLKWQVENDLVSVLQTVRKTVILVTHSMEETLRICSRILILDQGKIVDFGEKNQVMEHPRTLVSAQLAGYKNCFRKENVPGLFAQLPEEKAAGKQVLVLDAGKFSLAARKRALCLPLRFCYRTADQKKVYDIFHLYPQGMTVTWEWDRSLSELPVYQADQPVFAYYPLERILLF